MKGLYQMLPFLFILSVVWGQEAPDPVYEIEQNLMQLDPANRPESPIQYENHPYAHGRRLQEGSVFQPLRIRLDTRYLDISPDTEKVQYIKTQVLPEATKYWKRKIGISKGNRRCDVGEKMRSLAMSRNT